MKIKLINVEDRILLSNALLILGYKCSTSEGNISVDAPEELLEQIRQLTPENLKDFPEVSKILAEKELDEELVKEEERIKLERIIARDEVSVDVKELAEARLEEI